MNEDTAAAFHREGEPAFADEGNGEETPSESRTEDENQEGADPSHQGEDTGGEHKEIPFHDHPRWKQREEEWNSRFNEQEVRHRDEITRAIEGVRTEFGTKPPAPQPTKKPSWFGGTDEQWDAYKSDRDAELATAVESAEKRTIERLGKVQTDEDKAVADATAYMRTELTAIESDKTLNPTGAKVDAEKLLKVVLDNKLVDTDGRWNYRAGMRILSGQAAPAPKPKPDTTEKKEVAASTTSAPGKETKPSNVATSLDFKKNRPW